MDPRRLAGERARHPPADVQIAYGWKQIPLPIALELMEFEVLRNEGNDSPAGFKSTVRVTTPEGQTATGQCWMNNPFSFPGRMVARLDRAHLQNVAGLLEPREPRAKHHPDFTRSGLAPEMDRLAPHRLRHLHALLSERLSTSVRAQLLLQLHRELRAKSRRKSSFRPQPKECW